MAEEIRFTVPSSPLTAALPAVARRSQTGLGRAFRNPSVLIGGLVVLLMMTIGALAPFLGTMNPSDINPSARNKLPGSERTARDDNGNQIQIVHRLGTDSLGRDVYSRVLYGARAFPYSSV